MADLSNKTVWITGASSGIGRALAIEFCNQGAKCILSARSEKGLIETNNLTKLPGNNVVLALDVTNLEEIKVAVDKMKSIGDIDILVNNAGVSQRSKVEQTDISVYRSLMEVNFFGVVNMTKTVLPHMIQRGKGSIVTISSIAGKVGPPYRAGYAASKHALHGFFDSMRAETSHKGIHTLIVCPGYINTPIAHNALSANGKKYAKSDSENANGLEADDLAKRILRAIKNRKTEVYFGQFEVNAVRLKRFLPGVLTKMLNRKFLNDPEK